MIALRPGEKPGGAYSLRKGRKELAFQLRPKSVLIWAPLPKDHSLPRFAPQPLSGGGRLRVTNVLGASVAKRRVFGVAIGHIRNFYAFRNLFFWFRRPLSGIIELRLLYYLQN